MVPGPNAKTTEGKDEFKVINNDYGRSEYKRRKLSGRSKSGYGSHGQDYESKNHPLQDNAANQYQCRSQRITP